MPDENRFTAAASTVGYLYQVRLALALVLPHVRRTPGLEVSIERFDDVAFDEDGEPRELLQVKHRLTRAGNLADASEDLWKTLRVWSEAVAADPSIPERTRLVLLTTGMAPPGSAAALLRPSQCYRHPDRRDPKEAARLLEAAAEASGNAGLRPAFRAFEALSERMRASLLSSVEVVDRQPAIEDLGAVIEDELRYIATSSKVPEARRALEGWWWERVCDALRGRASKSIPVSEVDTRLEDVRDMFRRDALPVLFDAADLPPEQDVHYEAFRFIDQLRSVRARPRQISNAKRDFFRAFSQRSYWLREKAILDGDLGRFERRLIEEWEPRWDRMCSGCPEAPFPDPEVPPCGQGAIRVGGNGSTGRVQGRGREIPDRGFVPYACERYAARLASGVRAAARRRRNLSVGLHHAPAAMAAAPE